MIMTKKFFTLIVLLLFAWIGASAQTDVTDYITNPDFEAERHASGWMREGSFGPQGNTAFPLKHGTTYMERWNGGNNPIGSGNRVYQTLDRLPIGVYTVKAVAQNIREDNATAQQTGAFLFANDQTTEINLPAEYSVKTVVTDGRLTLGVYLENCTGNYVCVDYFRLYYSEEADMLRPYCQTYIDEGNSILTSGSSPERDELVAAIALMERYKSGELTEGIGDAFQRLINAIDAYKYSKASDSDPYDMTSKIINPSFESGVTGWTSDMGPQSNDGMGSYRDGALYLEKWQGDGGISAYATNIVNTVPSGHYTLKAAAHNILQSNEYATQSGAYIYGETERVAVNRLGEYSVNFTAVGGAEIGFVAENATGNWVAIDNFRLYYRGKASLSEMKNILQQRLTSAQSMATKQMDADLKAALNAAIALATSATTEDAINEAAAALKPAMTAARPSIEAYAQFLSKIQDAQQKLNASSGSEGRTEAQAVIDAAMALYDGAHATQAEMDAAVATLEPAIFLFYVNNGTGNAPTIEAYPDIIYGSKGAMGRILSTKGGVREMGFCWSESPNPTVFDNFSSEHYSGSGTGLGFPGDIYVMRPLKPSTQYYIRPYAVSNTYTVGYGEEVRIITGFESAIYWNCESDYNWGDTSDEGNEQVIAAMETSLNYLREWTSIRGFHPHLSYGIGYWGAQCSYGGWIDAGESYARNPGVLMHEMGHGVGVGQHWRYTSWDSPLHNTMYWTGERANRVFYFVKNSREVPADGDRVHVCFGLSGVTNPIDLMVQATFYQAMYEDGMPAVGDGACPFYSLESVDTLKYYITNEANSMTTKFLMDGTRMAYRTASVDEVLTDDAYAWYVHYDPYTGFYQLRNAKTNRYLSYTNSFAMVKVDNPGSDQNIQLMPCRYMTSMKVGAEEIKLKPYWMARSNRDIEPEVLAVKEATSSTLQSPKLDFYDTSVTQHWMLLDSIQMRKISGVRRNVDVERLRQLVAGSKELVGTDHTETVGSADADFQVQIAEAEALCDEIDETVDYNNAVKTFITDITTYLTKIEPTDIQHPLDISFLIDDPDLETGSSWTGDLHLSYSVTQYTNVAFKFTQSTPRLPKGTYRIRARAFQRPGVIRTAYSDLTKGNNNVTAQFSVNSRKVLLRHIGEGAVEEKFNEGGNETRVHNLYMPTNAESAHVYLSHGLYNNDIVFGLTANTSFAISVTETEAKENYWTVVDGFSIDYFGTQITRDEVTGVSAPFAETLLSASVAGYYTLSGMKVEQPLQHGITIVKMQDGTFRKVLMR